MCVSKKDLQNFYRTGKKKDSKHVFHGEIIA